MATITSARLSVGAGPGPDSVVVGLHGTLDAPAAASLQRVCDGILDDRDVRAIRVALRDVRSMDVDGMTGLAAAAERAEQRGAELTLSDPSEPLCRALESEGLTGLIRMGRHDRRPLSSATEIDGHQPRRHHPTGHLPVVDESHSRGQLGAVGDEAIQPRPRNDRTIRPGPGVTDAPRMSAEVSGVPARRAAAGADPMVALGAAWRGVACRGCGQRPENLAPLDAVAATRSLLRRCESLLHHHEDSLRHRRCRPGSWSAVEPAGRVSAVLDAANSRLRYLLRGATGEPAAVPIETPQPAPERRAFPAVLVSLAENAGRLAATINGATAEDWYRVRPDNGVTSGDVGWLGLHDATHHVEDAEVVVDGAVGERPNAWAAADSHLAETPVEEEDLLSCE